MCHADTAEPRIVFDDEGVCNACRHSERKDLIDWDARRVEFLELIDPYRSKDGGSWDWSVPWSGSKDSSSIAYRLKFEFGLNPLLVTFSPLLVNDVGAANREALIRLGFDHVFFRPDQRGAPAPDAAVLHRARQSEGRLGRRRERDPRPVRGQARDPRSSSTRSTERASMAAASASEEHQKRRDMTEVIEHQIGDDPRNWSTTS